VTGAHISGAILIESARQMVLSCIENYYIHPSFQYKSRFVWNDCSIRFKKFIFPVDVYILARLTEKKRIMDDRWRGTFQISFVQNGQIGCEATIVMSTYESKWLEEREFKEADMVCTNVMEECLLAA
jgi:hypothetical protein